MICQFLQAQNNVLELLPGSDRLEYDEKSGMHRLYGNVNFKYQGNTMFCDSAFYFQKKDQVFAYGNVHINKRDTLNLFCDSLFYDGKTRIAKLWGKVRVRDQEYKLTTDTLTYDARKSVAMYHYGGKVENTTKKETLTSRIGYLYPESKNFHFSKDVKYVSDDLRMTTDTLRYHYGSQKTYFYGSTHIQTAEEKFFCNSGWYQTQTGQAALYDEASVWKEKQFLRADTLLYEPEKGFSIGKGHVSFIDSTQKLNFTGNYAFQSDSLKSGYITGDAIASKLMDSDTIHIHADTLFHQTIDSVQYMRAHKRAKLFSSTFQGIGDSLVYNAQNGLISYYKNPIIWSENIELKGDTIILETKDSLLIKAQVFEGANLVAEVEKEKYYNQLAGKRIDAYFSENKLYRADISGNAQSLFFPTEQEESDSSIQIKRSGMNRLYSSYIRVDLDSGEVTGVAYKEKPDGVFYPMDQLKEDELFIRNFSWNPSLRPLKKEDLLIDVN